MPNHAIKEWAITLKSKQLLKWYWTLHYIFNSSQFAQVWILPLYEVKLLFGWVILQRYEVKCVPHMACNTRQYVHVQNV